MKKYVIAVLVGLCAILTATPVQGASLPISGKTILIDPGHGAFDPGKVGARNTLEKDINIQIALKLQTYLELSDGYVLMTRADDQAVGQTKNADMAGRKHIANTSEADILVSIHQNAFTDGKPRGPMVFHYSDEKQSVDLATAIQDRMNTALERSPNRKPKKNKSYFILKKTTIPAVIVECGFLTNTWDLDCLKQDSYQEKVAWAIYQGIVDYFEEQIKSS